MRLTGNMQRFVVCEVLDTSGLLRGWRNVQIVLLEFKDAAKMRYPLRRGAQPFSAFDYYELILLLSLLIS